MKVAGVRPLFPPECSDEEEANRRIRSVLSESPSEYGYTASRWSLERLQESLEWLDVETQSGMWGVLDRLGLSYQQGRTFVESPDEQFSEKCELIEQRRQLARSRADEVVIYFDELQYYRNPETAQQWGAQGNQPTVDRAACSKYGWSRHVLCAVDIQTGELFWKHDSSFDRFTYLELYEQLAESYPQASRISVVQDNHPVHFHVDVFEPLEPQQWPWEFYHPSHWTDPNPVARESGELPIQVTPLPTYASWLNPVERIWRDLKRQVLYMHDNARDVDELKRKVDAYLESLEADRSRVLQTTSLACA